MTSSGTPRHLSSSTTKNQREAKKRRAEGDRVATNNKKRKLNEELSMESNLGEDSSSQAKWNCPMQDCSCLYTRKGDLKFHFKQKHPDSLEVLYAAFPELSRNRSTKKSKTWCCPLTNCPCGYGRLCDLKNHFILRHSEVLDDFPALKPSKVYHCNLCKMKFARHQVLNRHLLKTHNKNPNIDSSDEYYHIEVVEEGSEEADNMGDDNNDNIEDNDDNEKDYNEEDMVVEESPKKPKQQQKEQPTPNQQSKRVTRSFSKLVDTEPQQEQQIKSTTSTTTTTTTISTSNPTPTPAPAPTLIPTTPMPTPRTTAITSITTITSNNMDMSEHEVTITFPQALQPKSQKFDIGYLIETTVTPAPVIISSPWFSEKPRSTSTAFAPYRKTLDNTTESNNNDNNNINSNFNFNFNSSFVNIINSNNNVHYLNDDFNTFFNTNYTTNINNNFVESFNPPKSSSRGKKDKHNMERKKKVKNNTCDGFVSVSNTYSSAKSGRNF